ncbi:phage tail spike protein [Peptococcus niger]|uniref:Phage minor structural protein, N-terminal region n=1 Tax=Peptococcus niger TaxID=2741 RepID=A0A1G6RQH0_PEPNI|nr:phage tail spike protein [Peptococcus niger]SDD06663.1 phage minor structural protein, N-terminal region [Peptococcus niger]
MIPELQTEDYFYDDERANHFIGFLPETTSCLVTEKRNDTFTLEMAYPLSGRAVKDITPERIIVARSDMQTKRQPFRIAQIKRNIASGNLDIYAEHISYDLLNYPLKPDTSFTTTGAADAMRKLEDICVGIEYLPFSLRSSISGDRTFHWRISEVHNAREALGGVRGSILDKYHGEYLFKDTTIRLMTARGRDRGVAFIYGVNLIDAEIELDMSNFATSIYPYSGGEDDAIITLPEYYIDSPLYKEGQRRQIKVVDFSSDEIKSVDALRKRTKRYISDNNVGQPSIHATVSGADISRTFNGIDAKSQILALCDTVRVLIPHLDIDLKAKVTALTYDTLKEEVKSIELGDPRPTLRETLQVSVDQLGNRVGTLSGVTARLAEDSVSSKVKDSATEKNYYIFPVIKNGTLTWEKQEQGGT